MTTAKARAAARVTYQLETLWDYDYEPTHAELETLYETAKKNQWNGSTAIDWSHRPGAAGAGGQRAGGVAGGELFPRPPPRGRKEGESPASARPPPPVFPPRQGAALASRQPLPPHPPRRAP